MRYIHNVLPEKPQEQLLKKLNESSFSEEKKKFLSKKIRSKEINTRLLEGIFKLKDILDACDRELDQEILERYIKAFKNAEEEYKKMRAAEELDWETLHRPMTF